jgi:hypothetical protein
MKATIKVLKDQPSNSVEGLINALRWIERTLQILYRPKDKTK